MGGGTLVVGDWLAFPGSEEGEAGGEGGEAGEGWAAGEGGVGETGGGVSGVEVSVGLMGGGSVCEISAGPEAGAPCAPSTLSSAMLPENVQQTSVPCPRGHPESSQLFNTAEVFMFVPPCV